MNEPSSGLSEELIVQILAYALAAAHLVVLVWYWLRRDVTPVLTLNLIASGVVMIYWAPRLGELAHYVDTVTAFVAFEAIVFLTSVAGFVTQRVLRLLILLACIGNAILIAGALYFLLTFKLTRLF